MVALATRPSGGSTARSYQTKTATVMLGRWQFAGYSSRNSRQGSLYFSSHSTQTTSVGRKASSTSPQDAPFQRNKACTQSLSCSGVEVLGDQRAPVIDVLARFVTRVQRDERPIAWSCARHENDLDAEPVFDGSAHRVENAFAVRRFPADMHNRLRVAGPAPDAIAASAASPISTCRRATMLGLLGEMYAGRLAKLLVSALMPVNLLEPVGPRQPASAVSTSFTQYEVPSGITSSLKLYEG